MPVSGEGSWGWVVGEEWNFWGVGERKEGTSLSITHYSYLKSKTSKSGEGRD